MRFVTFRDSTNSVRSGIESDGVLFSFENLGLSYTSILDFIVKKGDLATINNAIHHAQGTPLERATLLAPIPHPQQDIICLGINYLDHAKESARFKKEAFDGKRENAVYFGKRVSEAVGANGDVPSHSDITQELDYEVELAFVLGVDLYKASRDEAINAIFGYTIINELSARDLQLRHKQWYFGKSLEGCCVMGPCIVSADEFGGIPSLDIKSFVNGELRQDSNTSHMIFDIGDILVELSSAMRLRAGSIISTGTPKGVGMGFVPPRFLKSGDIVECQIEQIGSLKNRIV